MKRVYNNSSGAAAGLKKKAPTQPKSKKQEHKVVYITNPMKFKASVSEFRSLVQELTGKDSDVMETLDKYTTVVTCEEDSSPKSSSSANIDPNVSVQFELFDDFETLPWFVTAFADLEGVPL